jgi:hypothetical protein
MLPLLSSHSAEPEAMSASPHLPSPFRHRRHAAPAVLARRPVAVAVTLAMAALVARPRAAHATDLVLEGPHPFLRENALSVNYLLGTGLGRSFSGQGLGVNYGYMASGPLWLDLQLNYRGSTCPPWRNACGPYTGNAFEILAGVAWRFRLDIPVVPFVRANAGLVFLYPDGSTSAVGLAARAGAGGKYFVYDWLGFGAEIALSVGHGFFVSQYAGSRVYAVIDMILGVEIQFD